MDIVSDDIIRQAAGGDMHAFESVYKATAGFVYNVAYRIAGNRQDAEEVTQEVYIMLYQKLQGFRFESAFKTWVYRITVNTALNFIRKNPRPIVHSREYDDGLIPDRQPSELEKHIDAEHHAQLIESLLQAVNPEQRACVVLRNIEGLSYEEIAQALQININTVRSRLSRAREKFMELRKKVAYGQV